MLETNRYSNKTPVRNYETSGALCVSTDRGKYSLLWETLYDGEDLKRAKDLKRIQDQHLKRLIVAETMD